MRRAVRSDATAFGYTVFVTACFGLVNLVGTVTYVTAAGVQMAMARRFEERHPPRTEE